MLVRLHRLAPAELVMGKVIDMAAWLANSYIIDGRRQQVNDRNIKRAKVRLALSGSKSTGGTTA